MVVPDSITKRRNYGVPQKIEQMVLMRLGVIAKNRVGKVDLSFTTFF